MTDVCECVRSGAIFRKSTGTARSRFCKNLSKSLGDVSSTSEKRLQAALPANYFSCGILTLNIGGLNVWLHGGFPVNDETIVRFSQQEIADIPDFAKPKVNTIIRELKDAGCIVQERKAA